MLVAMSTLGFASCAFGTQVTMQLTSPGNNGLGGVYVAPYYASINGGTSLAVICDDYADESWVGAPSWNANVVNVSTLQGEGTPNALVMFDKSPGTQAEANKQQQDYAEAAYLAVQLMNPGTLCPSTADCVGDIQYAIWNIFDPSAFNGIKYTSGPLSALTGNDLSNALYWQGVAQNLYASNAISVGMFSNVTVYSPVGGGPPQEFLRVTTPEASTLANLAADMLGLMGLVLVVRRRTRRAAR